MRHLSREGSACLGDAPFFQKRESGGPCAPLPRPTGSPSSGLACLRGSFGLPALPPAPPSPAPQGHFPVAPGILAAQGLPLPPSPGQKAGKGFSLDSKASPAASWSRCPDRVGGEWAGIGRLGQPTCFAYLLLGKQRRRAVLTVRGSSRGLCDPHRE